MPIDKFYLTLPKKIIASCVIFFNDRKEILLVKPTYRDHWQLPGGVVDENESPLQGATREIKEELDLNVKNLKFLCVDYVSSIIEAKVESLQFVFFGGPLGQKEINKIKLPVKELSDYKFVSLKEARILTSSKKVFISLPGRVKECLKAIIVGKSIYLEDGQKK